MPTLKDYIDKQRFTGEDDITIIRRWFCENNREQDGLELIAELSKSKSDKLENTLNYARTWLPSLPDVYDSNKGINKDTASYIMRITKYHILGCKLPNELKLWAEANIPNMDTPKVIFVPMVEWLKKEYGIEFKDKCI